MNSYVSVKQVIDKLLGNNIYQKNFNQADTISWIGDAIRSIKGGVELKDKVCLMEVKDYMCGYPKDYVRIRNIFRDNRLLKRKQYLHNNTLIPKERYDSDKGQSLDPYYYTSSAFDELMKQLQVRDNIINVNYEVNRQELLDGVYKNIDYLIGIIRTQNTHVSDEWFDDNTDCIQFSFETGYVVYDYKGYVLDENGLFKIYNNHEYLECLFYYCLYMNELNQGRYNEAILLQRNYETYLHRAINQIKRMSTKQMQDFSDNWTNLLFNLNDNQKPFYQN